MESPLDRIAFEIPEVAAHLQRARDELQQNLVAAATDRRQQDDEVRQAKSAAEERVKAQAPDTHLLDRYIQAWEQHGVPGAPPLVETPPASVAEAAQRWSDAVARCEAVLSRFRDERAQHEVRSRKFFARTGEPPRLPEAFRQDLWRMQAVADVFPALQASEVDGEAQTARERASELGRTRSASRLANLETVLAGVRAEVTLATELLGSSAEDWTALLDHGRPAPTWTDARTRIGVFDAAIPGSGLDNIPCVIPFPASRSLAIEAPAASRQAALSFSRSIVLRVLANTPPGKTEITFIDPIAVGGSIADFLHLGDFEERLVDTAPRTSQAAIETRLNEHAAHVEMVISKYLRGQFQSLEDYNRSAGEMAEALRLLVVFDFPTQFSDRAAEQLLSIIENGPRCGIVTLLLLDPDRESTHGPSYERLLASMDVLRWNNDRVSVTLAGRTLPLEIVPDRCPPLTFDAASKAVSPAAQLLVDIGTAARRTDDATVDFDRSFDALSRLIDGGLATRVPTLPSGGRIDPLRPDTWWSGNSATSAVAPIGRSGAQDIASLYFSSTDIAGGALVIGLPRSGKTTSLHAAILSLCMIYSPDELELYLIDAKHGVEFTSYRDLPHARMVAINREREFAVAVLQSLDKEIERRAELMKREAPGRTNLGDYRAATGATLPRVVVIIDEFHEIFEEDDRLGHAAFDAFSNIVRQGPFAGVHLVLASQTLSSMPAMDRSTLMLLPTRVAFACNESDAQIVLGDDNPDARLLDSAGDGLLNPNRGNPAHNQRFRGIFVGPDERAALIRSIIGKASSSGFERRPRVFDGDALASRDAVDSRAFLAAADRPYQVRCVIGEPLSLEPQLSVAFRRDQDANMLIVATGDDEGLPAAGAVGVLHSVLLGSASQLNRVEVIDYLVDDGHRGTLDLDALCSRLSIGYHRRRRSDQIIRELATLVAERQALEDYKSPGVMLVLMGIGRATELDPDAYSYDGDEVSLSTALQAVLRDGPDVGVHVTVLADSASAVQRRLGSSALDLFGLRLAGQLRSDSERQGILEDFRGVEVRGGQMLLFDRRTDRRTKFQPFGPVTAEWLDLASLEARLDSTNPEETI